MTDDPSAEAVPATFPAPVRAAADRADGALARLLGLADHAASQRARLDQALAGTIEACRVLAAATAASTAAVLTERIPPQIPIHEYFGVGQAAISPRQAAAHAAAVVYRGLADLQYPLLDVNDMVAEVAAMRLVLTDLIGPAGEGDHADAGQCLTGDGYRPSGEGLERWIVAHHLYFLLNLRAAAEVHTGLRALKRGASAEAARALAHAARYVRGFTAAMAHSTAMPTAYYNAHVRLTMGPPHASVNLTGGMQPQHRAFRSSMRRLIAALPDEHDDLAQREPALAAARAALLDADLIDIERHVHVADKLIGNSHSLVQRDESKENAVSVLRAMRHNRAAQYAPLMPHGDQLARAGVAATRQMP